MRLDKPDLYLDFTQLRLRLTWGGGGHGLGNEATVEYVGSCTLERTSHGAAVNMPSTFLPQRKSRSFILEKSPTLSSMEMPGSTLIQCGKTASSVQ